jgi:hypothetical protein
MVKILLAGVAACALAMAASPQDDAFESLIRKLGSSVAKEREAATEELKAKPEAVAALRRATKSMDPEISRRARLVLDYYDQKLLKEFQTAATDGRVANMIDMALKLPNGKDDTAVFETMIRFAEKLNKCHAMEGGAKMPLRPTFLGPPYGVKADRVTEETPGEFPGRPLLRAGQVDYDTTRLRKGQPGNSFPITGAVIISKGRVQLRGVEWTRVIILAGGDVEIRTRLDGCILVSCGDVVFRNGEPDGLVIARGSVTCDDTLYHSRVISGKNVVLKKKKDEKSKVTENESNPFGFIQWESAKEAKEKKKATP